MLISTVSRLTLPYFQPWGNIQRDMTCFEIVTQPRTILYPPGDPPMPRFTSTLWMDAKTTGIHKQAFHQLQLLRMLFHARLDFQRRTSDLIKGSEGKLRKAWLFYLSPCYAPLQNSFSLWLTLDHSVIANIYLRRQVGKKKEEWKLGTVAVPYGGLYKNKQSGMITSKSV